MNKHEAIFLLNPSVVTISDDKAFDKDGNLVEYNAIELQDYIDSMEYKNKRLQEYPDFKDYIDGVVKNDQAQIQAYIDACLAVKQKYPKKQQ
jgi:hypothetical protein